ncbi:hypothetical protein DPEC_G00149110 [Dallia pectoralis]|uniref:Uncharacterized protein n=1 Tax=Dallia pectoralis TaxID=75939 RepID=A0ACC2GIU1_DALPE|nr:hypothetical protein DPEC_G00149110 [Dallia pectoralis]
MAAGQLHGAFYPTAPPNRHAPYCVGTVRTTNRFISCGNCRTPQMYPAGDHVERRELGREPLNAGVRQRERRRQFGHSTHTTLEAHWKYIMRPSATRCHLPAPAALCARYVVWPFKYGTYATLCLTPRWVFLTVRSHFRL